MKISLLVFVVFVVLVVSTSVVFAATYTAEGEGVIPSVNGVKDDMTSIRIDLKTVGEPNVYERGIEAEAKGDIRIVDRGTGYKIQGEMVEFSLSKSHQFYYNFKAVHDPDKRVAGDEKIISGYVGVKGSLYEGTVSVKVEDSASTIEYENTGVLVKGKINTAYTPAQFTIKGEGVIPSANGIVGDKASIRIDLKTVGEPAVYERGIEAEAEGDIRLVDHGTGYRIQGEMVEFSLSKSHQFYYNFKAVYDPDKGVAGDEKIISGYVGVKGSLYEGTVRVKVEDSTSAIEYDNTQNLVKGKINTAYKPAQFTINGEGKIPSVTP